MLTDQQENFARAIALEGMNQSDAYRACYNTETERQATVWDAASKLANHPEVSKRISELRGESASSQVMSATKRKEKLTEFIADPNVDVNAKLKAIDLLNKMDGEYIQKIAAEVKAETTVINIELVDDDE